jgi:cell wall-associated protease
MLITSAPVPSAPSPSARVRAVVIVADRTVPQPACTPIRWTARAGGGEAPYEYKWLVYNGAEWHVAQNWSDSDTFAWRPAFANTRYRVAVWVRGFGNRRDECEATTEAAFAIDEVPRPAPRARSSTPLAVDAAPVSPVSTVVLCSDCASPQPAGTAITWTAIATGGGTRPQFKWFVYDGSSWTIASPWSRQSTFSWTPAAPNQRYRIAVWARTTGNTQDDFEASADAGFPVIGT